jgi:hypothetical protein
MPSLPKVNAMLAKPESCAGGRGAGLAGDAGVRTVPTGGVPGAGRDDLVINNVTLRLTTIAKAAKIK